jgi:ribosome-associated translation inhibitor RaiA
MSYNWPTPELTVSQKVGIGTDTPTEALEVKGKVKLEQGTAINEFSTDSNLTDNSNLAIPTERAVKTYVDSQINQANQVIASKANSSDLTAQISQVIQSFQTEINNAKSEIQSLRQELNELKVRPTDRIYSQNKQYFLIMQNDFNVVAYEVSSGKAVWASKVGVIVQG